MICGYDCEYDCGYDMNLQHFQHLERPVLYNSTNVLNDTFSDTLSAGSINGTFSDSGHERFVTDTNSKLSMGSGVLSFATGGVGVADPGLGYTAFFRKNGLCLFSEITVTANIIEFGFDQDASGAITNAARLATTTIGVRTPTVTSVGTTVSGTTYNICICVFTVGSAIFIKNGIYANWNMLYNFGSSFVYQTLYPYIKVASTATVGTVSSFRIARTLYTPTSLVSDSFTNASKITDGKGNISIFGGDGYTWVDDLGTWQSSSSAFSALTLSGGVALATIDCGKLDVLVCVSITHASGTASVVARYVDSNNFLRASVTGTNIQLVSTVSGTPTTLIDSAVTYVAGAELRLHCVGTAVRIFYNGAAVGTEQTTTLTTGTKVGVRTSSTSNSFTYFYVNARGSEANEYAILDSI